MDMAILPKFLQVELTYACNSACSFCYNPTHNGKINHEKLLKILEEINSYQIRHVQLIGGEVSILPNLPIYLEALDKVRWRSIVTNGRRFREDIKGLVDEVYVSIHGEKEMHEVLTSEPNSFEKIENAIIKYVSWGIEVNSDTVLTKYNADSVYKIAAHAKSLGMKRLFLNIFQPEGLGSTRKDFSPSIEQIRSAIDQMIAARSELGIEMHFGTSTPLCLDERLFTERLGFRCGVGEWFASINPQGELRVCNHSMKSYGNVTESSLGRIWHSSEITSEYRNANPSESNICNGCAAFSICRGGCRIDQSGNYRVDPIVLRDKDKLVNHEKISILTKSFHNNPFLISHI